jgi:AraC-like DNA-binding protein
MTASLVARRCSLAFEHRRTVVDGTLLAPGAETVLGRLTSAEARWAMRADGFLFGGSAALRAVASAGSAWSTVDRTQGVIIIGSVTSGRLDLETLSTTAAVAKGGIFFLGPGARTRLRWQEPTMMVLSSVPANVAGSVGVVLDRPAGSLSVEATLAEPIMRFVETLASGHESPSPLSLHILDQLMQEQSGALLLSSEGFGDELRMGRHGLYGRALQLMVAKRAEPLVTPASIAADLNVSLRQLQRVFQDHSDAPAAALRRLRADLARQMLDDERYSSIPVSEIARHAGFSSSQVMRRVLRQLDVDAIR